YAVSSLHQFTTSLNVDLPAEEEEVRSRSHLSPSYCPTSAVSSQNAFPSCPLSFLTDDRGQGQPEEGEEGQAGQPHDPHLQPQGGVQVPQGVDRRVHLRPP